MNFEEGRIPDVTYGAAAKGDWEELIAAGVTDFDVTELTLMVSNDVGATNLGRHPVLTDIGIGAETEEQVLVPNVAIYGEDASGDGTSLVIWRFRCKIPAGVRIAVRGQTASAGKRSISLFR